MSLHRTVALKARVAAMNLSCATHANTDAAMPFGYVERSEWMKQKGKTHVQWQCPECGLWAIWIPKEDLK